MPTERFKSEEAYRRSRAYTHIHGIPTHAKYVVVAGKKHKVQHGGKMKKTAHKVTGHHLMPKGRKSNAAHIAAFKNTPSKIRLKKTARKKA
jgi:hypothetical protein